MTASVLRRRSLSIKQIALRAELPLEDVIAAVRKLMYYGIVRTIDTIVPFNEYVLTSQVNDLIRSRTMR